MVLDNIELSNEVQVKQILARELLDLVVDFNVNKSIIEKLFKNKNLFEHI